MTDNVLIRKLMNVNVLNIRKNVSSYRKTALLTEDYLGWVYSVMAADQNLGVFSVRTGQIFNILLFKAGNPSMSITIYKIVSRIYSIFHA